MGKAKIKFVVEIEYEQNPEYYPEGITREEMLEIDLEGANADPFVQIDSAGAEWVITGELL